MMTSYFNLLKYAATGIAAPDMTYYDRMRASTLMGGVVQTLTGQPPLSFKADGTPLISWSMKGNGSQSGTPTPDAPIMPTFCGVRTGNLFDPNSTRYQMGKGPDNRISYYAGGAMFYIKASPNTEYTIKIHNTDSTFVRLYLSNNPIVENTYQSYDVISESETTINPEVTISNTDYAYLWIQVGGLWYTEHGGDLIMLNLGSTALAYEPYGYKIPITCVGQTTPVYLGEVPTVRRVKKLVLTGEETVNYPNVNCFRFDVTDYLREQINKPYCTHYVGINPVSGVDGVGNKRIAFLVSASGNNYMYIRDTSYSTVADFKSYLAQQYANGTPVVIWYVLAEAQTGISNEPLAKIGDYADELHSTDAGVSVPTVKGNNTLTVETDLPPSEMTITFKG